MLDVTDSPRFVGHVGFRARDRGVVELVYGVAPGWRGRGLATRATILATHWLVAEQRVPAVELRIGREHGESQRVAEKAEFRLAGTVRQNVAATGETFEDLSYSDTYRAARQARLDS